MKIKIAGSAAFVAMSLLLSSCQSSTSPADLPEDFDFSQTQIETEDIQVVTIWAPEAVSSSLSGISGAFEDEYGVNIQFVNLELGEIKARLEAGDSPDIFFGSHTWTGELAEAGIIARLREGVLGDRVPAELIDAFSFNEDFYGVAVSEQHVALVCNSELIDQQPEISDLQEMGLGLALDGQLGDPYHLYPFMSSFGLGFEDLDAGFAEDAGFDYAEWMSTEGSELFALGEDYTTVLNKFNLEEIACWLTGPWALNAFTPELRDSLVIYPVPQVGDEPVSALVDAAGFFVAASSDDPVYANRLVFECFTRSSSQLAVARSLSGIPAVETDDELLSQFSLTLENATPTPAGDLVESLWPVLGSTQAELIRSEESSEQIWSEFLSKLDTLISKED